jgi:CRP-like cAMP-binding protein
MLDHNMKEHLAMTLLVESDHFGEISLLYRCPRTCSVVSRNYNTMARLSRPQAREIMNEYPAFKRAITHYTFAYKDAKINFIKKMICSIDYFKGIGRSCLNELTFRAQSS